jgi:hypothetical protein
MNALADRWHITPISGLSAHFYTENGESKPGTDWAVSLKNRGREKRVIVRIFDDNVARGQRQQSEAIIGFLAHIINGGWVPENYEGEPGELVVPTHFCPMPKEYQPKPWWRFW